MTCQNAADESRTGPTALGYVGLLSCSGIISRFGRQVRLGEHVDSGLTAYRHSEFVTLDKMRLRYKTRLGRFITSPWRLAFLRLHHHNLTSHAFFWGQTPKHITFVAGRFGGLEFWRDILKLLISRTPNLPITKVKCRFRLRRRHLEICGAFEIFK